MVSTSAPQHMERYAAAHKPTPRAGVPKSTARHTHTPPAHRGRRTKTARDFPAFLSNAAAYTLRQRASGNVPAALGAPPQLQCVDTMSDTVRRKAKSIGRMRIGAGGGQKGPGDTKSARDRRHRLAKSIRGEGEEGAGATKTSRQRPLDRERLAGRRPAAPAARAPLGQRKRAATWNRPPGPAG